MEKMIVDVNLRKSNFFLHADGKELLPCLGITAKLEKYF